MLASPIVISISNQSPACLVKVTFFFPKKEFRIKRDIKMNSFINWMYGFFYTTLSFICYTWQIYFFTLLLTLISPVFIRLHNNNNPWSKTSYHKLSCDFSLKCKQYFSILKHCYATRFISKTRASVGVAGFYLIIEGLAINKSKQLHFLRCHNPCPAHYFKVKPAHLHFPPLLQMPRHTT